MNNHDTQARLLISALEARLDKQETRILKLEAQREIDQLQIKTVVASLLCVIEIDAGKDTQDIERIQSYLETNLSQKKEDFKDVLEETTIQ